MRPEDAKELHVFEKLRGGGEGQSETGWGEKGHVRSLTFMLNVMKIQPLWKAVWQFL